MVVCGFRKACSEVPLGWQCVLSAGVIIFDSV